jgi:lytic murein transglycosylase
MFLLLNDAVNRVDPTISLMKRGATIIPLQSTANVTTRKMVRLTRSCVEAATIHDFARQWRFESCSRYASELFPRHVDGITSRAHRCVHRLETTTPRQKTQRLNVDPICAQIATLDSRESMNRGRSAVPHHRLPSIVSRRAFVTGMFLGAGAAVAVPIQAHAQTTNSSFEAWRDAFRARATARGVSEATYAHVMGAIKPDTSVYAQIRSQPEFNEALWQYINRRVSDWRIITGKERAKEYAPLLARIETQYGVDRFTMLALWGVESSYGEVIDNPKYMRPVIPALAALAWGEPRRRSYWEAELLNALVIIERGWGAPKEMVGSWAGAMGHTQWMPEVWLHMGVDFDRDGRISPYGAPDDALGGTARFLIERGKYRGGEAWGCEVRLPDGHGGDHGTRTYAAWRELGVTRADGAAFPRPDDKAKLSVPVDGGPALLIGQNFSAVMSYNPAFSYSLAVVHLADRIRGGSPFVHPFPGSERLMTLAEVQELQRRLTALGFDTDGSDGRVGRDTQRAVRDFQRKVGISPADGYAGLKVLARLRQGA